MKRAHSCIHVSYPVRYPMHTCYVVHMPVHCRYWASQGPLNTHDQDSYNNENVEIQATKCQNETTHRLEQKRINRKSADRHESEMTQKSKTGKTCIEDAVTRKKVVAYWRHGLEGRMGITHMSASHHVERPQTLPTPCNFDSWQYNFNNSAPSRHGEKC